MLIKNSQKLLSNQINYLTKRKSSLLFNFKYQFSSTQKTIEQSKQFYYRSKCQLADRVMNIIETKENYEKLHQCSLRDYILISIDKKQNGDSKAKSQIASLFSGGIQITPQFEKIYTQTRIIEEFKLKKQKRLTFCPTYYITSRIFQQINQSTDKNRLFTGHFGFSKTFSLLLYARLTNYIIDYRLRYPNQAKNLSNSILQRPKVFYRNINIEKDNPQLQHHSDYIQYNCKQLENLPQQSISKLSKNQQQYQQILKEPKFQPIYKQSDSQILDLYRKNNIQIIQFIDQFNIISEVLKQIQKINQDISSANSKEEQQDKIQKYRQIYKYYLKNRNKLQIIKRKHIKLLSSLKNVFLLSNIDMSYDSTLINFNFTGQQTHQSLITNKIDFISQINHDITILQMIDVFIFQLGQRNKLENKQFQSNWYTSISQQCIGLRNRIRQKLFQSIKSNKQYFYLSPLTIRKYFQNITPLTTDQINISNFQNSFPTLFKQCILYSNKPLIQKLQNFINNNNQQQQLKDLRSIILFRIYDYAYNHNTQNNKIKQKFQNIFTQQQIILINKNKPQTLCIKQFYQITNKQQIILYFNPKFFVNLMNNYKNQKKYDILQIRKRFNLKSVRSKFISIFQRQQQAFNVFFKGTFIRSILLENTKLILRYNMFTKIFFMYKTQIDKVLYVKSVPITKKSLLSYSILQQIKHGIITLLIKNKKENSNKCLILVPKPNKPQFNQVYQGSLQNRNKKNPIFDFILLNQQQSNTINQKKVQVMLIDSSVNQSKIKIADKVFRFLRRFVYFQDSNNPGKMKLDYKFQNEIFQTNVQIVFKYFIFDVDQQFKSSSIFFKKITPIKVTHLIQIQQKLTTDEKSEKQNENENEDQKEKENENQNVNKNVNKNVNLKTDGQNPWKKVPNFVSKIDKVMFFNDEKYSLLKEISIIDSKQIKLKFPSKLQVQNLTLTQSYQSVIYSLENRKRNIKLK